MIRQMVARLRPTVALAIVILGSLCGSALAVGAQEVAAIAATGIVAMGRDIIAADEATDGETNG